MKREDVYLEVLSEKTGEPKERLLLLLDVIKERMNDDLSDELGEEQAEYLRDRLRKLPRTVLEGIRKEREK